MKKLLLLLVAILFLISNTNSQIIKGNWLVGGSGIYSSQHQKTSTSEVIKYSQLAITPNIGIFIVDKFAAGLHLGAYYTKNVASTTSKASTYSVGPFARYYFLPKENVINLFAEGNYAYSTNRFNNSGMTAHSSYYVYSFLAGPVIYFNTSIGLELNVGYYHRGNKDNPASNIVQIAIGFQIHLKK